MAKIVDKEAKKREIMQAAIRTFAEKGIGGTKVHDIAKAAGVSQGTIYLYFKNKDDIFDQLLKMHAELFDRFLDQILLGATDPRDKLKRLILGVCQQSQNMYAAFTLEVWGTIIREPDRPYFREDLKKIRRMLQDILDEGVQAGQFKQINSETLAVALVGMHHGLQLLWMLDRDQFPSLSIAEYALDTILKGIEKTEP